MSDTINPISEALEEIKTEVNTAVETKASNEALDLVKADLDAANEAAQTAATEAAAQLEALKSEAAAELEAAKSEANDAIEALEAKFDALPTITETPNKEETKMEFTQNETNVNKFELSLDTTKSYADNTDVTGGRVEAEGIRHDLAQANVLRAHAHILNTTSGSIKLPLLSAGSFAEEGTVNASRTEGGAISSKTVVVKNFVGQNAISKPAVEDITGFDATMTSLMVQEAGAAEAADAIAALNAESSYASVTATADLIADMSDMIATLGSAYKLGAKWFVSREAMSAIRKADVNGLVFDATSGQFTIFGHAVVVVDGLDAGDTTGDKSIYFGNMDRALVIVSRKNLELTRMMEVTPGMVTYFGDLRSVASSWDVNALVCLTAA